MIGKKILIISPEPWGKNFVSKHHYANYLSKNNTVYFLNPAHSFSKIPLATISLKTKQVQPNLIQVDYVNLLPKLDKYSLKRQASIYKRQAQLIQKKLNIETFDLIWSFDPYRFFEQSVWKAKTYIYHTVDIHSDQRKEQIIASSSDLVLSVSPYLEKRLTIDTPIHIISHGADLDNYEIDNTVELPGKNNLKVCYVANFRKEINYDILLQIVAENPRIDFVFIGPTEGSNLSKVNAVSKTKLVQIQQNENAYFMGSITAHSLMSYVAKADINLILYQDDRIYFPHKIPFYLYSGNVILSNHLVDYESSDLLITVPKLSKIPEKFSTVITKIDYYNQPDFSKKRKSLAIENSYSNKIKTIENLIYGGIR